MILIAEFDQIPASLTASGSRAISEAISGAISGGISGTSTGRPQLARYIRLGMPRSREEELAFVSAAQATRITGIYLSGVDCPADVEKASVLLRVAEAKADKAEGALIILAEIATAKAALGIESFNRAIPRLGALVFNGNGLALDIGAEAMSSSIQSVCLKVPLAARASAASALLWISAPEPADRLRAAWQMAKANGFSGVIVADRQQADLLET